ncbi:hypothetical protein N9N67_11035, partial [Bacteriovoracaceae bacterium]|nr:hypothetical protein [Bacteriovoracaceae bacterium]
MDKKINNKPDILSMEGIPVLDQGDLSHCGLVTTSYLLDSYRNVVAKLKGESLKNVSTSPLQLALSIGYQEKYNLSDINRYGNNENEYYCSMSMENSMSRHITTYFTNSLSTDSQLKICSEQEEMRILDERLELRNNLAKSLAALDRYYMDYGMSNSRLFPKECEIDLLGKCQKTMKLSKLKKFLAKMFSVNKSLVEKIILEEKDPILVISKILEKRCKEENKIIVPTEFNTDVRFIADQQKNSVEQINKHFNNQYINEKWTPTPIQINFCSNFVNYYPGEEDPPGYSLDFKGFPNGWESKVPDCNPHASVILGRKKVGEKCHFLVRDTQGVDCYYVRPELNCENETG